MADNVLRVAAEFDVSPIIAGTQKAVASFNELGSAVSNQAAKFKAAGLSDAELTSALQNLGYSSKEAIAAVAELGGASDETASQVQLLQTQVNELTGALEKASAGAKEGSTSFSTFRSSMGEARVEAGALTGSTGMVLGGFARLAASSQALQPLISAAFPVLAAAALIDIVKSVATAYDNMINSLAGWDAAAQKAYDNLIKENVKLYVSTVETANEIRNQNLIGKEGMEKFSLAAKDNAENLKAIGEATAVLQRGLEKDNEELQKMESMDNRIVEALGLGSQEFEDHVKRLQANIAGAQSAIDTLVAKQRELQGPKKDENAAEEAAEAIRLSREVREAEIENAKAVGLAQAEAHKQQIQQLQTQGAITPDQSAGLLQGVEDDKLKIEQKYYQDSIALLRSEGSAHLNEIKRMEGEELTLTINSDAAKRQIQNKAADEDRKAYQALAKGLQEDFLRSLEQKAKEFEEEQKQELAEQEEGIKQQIESARAGAAAVQEANRVVYSEKLESLRTYEASAIVIAENEYNREIELYAREAALYRKLGEEHILSEEEVSKKLKAIYGEEEKAYQQMSTQIQKVQDEAAKKQEQSIDQLSKKWAQDWVQMTNSVLKGQETIGQAFVRLAAQMELQMIDKGIAFVVQKTSQYLLQLLASHVSFLAQLLGIQVAGNASAIAADKAKAVADVGSEAAIAGAAGFASVMAALPFPANIATAPAIAASASASTLAQLSVAAFEIGGVVPGTSGVAVPAIVHGGERVLTPQQNATFEKAASGGGNRSGDIHVHINHQGTNMTQTDMVRAVKVGIRKGQLGNRF